jgi:Ca2+-binding RTX toxin-like protein
VAFLISNPNIVEGEDLVFTITRTGSSTAAEIVGVTIAVTPLNSAMLPAMVTVNFAAGQTTQTFGFNAANFQLTGDVTITASLDTAIGIGRVFDATASPFSLIISEMVEGTSNNKAIELYNSSGTAFDLFQNGIAIRIYLNGSSTPSNTIALTGIVPAGGTFVVANSSATTSILNMAQFTSAFLNFNGNDAIELFNSVTQSAIDVIGQIGFNPGVRWGSDPVSTLNTTLVRNVWVGDINGADLFDPSQQWTALAVDTHELGQANFSIFRAIRDVVNLNLFDLSIFSLSQTTDALDGDDRVALSATQNIGVLFNGGAGNDWITGTGSGADSISGGAGNDVLDGGLGADTMFGGIGDDTYFIDNYGDHAFENLGEGTDTVNTSVSYVMEANIENVTLTGIAANNDGVLGNVLANIINGNGGNNGIASGDGNDTINAGLGNDVLDGGIGADAMSGGLGSDVYFVDNVGDTVLGETAEAGVYDTVWTTVNFTLPSEVEILILNGGILAINGTGNAGAGGLNPNLMLGNNAVNVLTTFGGDDIILGLDGNDTISAGGSSVAGYNLIVGGNGSDLMTAGSGHDFFAYSNISEAGDTINSFSTAGGNGLDILDLRTMFTTFTGWGGGTATTAETLGYLTYTPSGADTQVFADANGGAHNAGEQILLATITSTTAAAVQNVTLV